MKQTVNEYRFRNAFYDHGREDRFSYEGVSALFHYLEELEIGTGCELELDIIELCCQYCEYGVEDFTHDYGHAMSWGDNTTMKDIKNFLDSQGAIYFEARHDTIIVDVESF